MFDNSSGSSIDKTIAIIVAVKELKSLNGTDLLVFFLDRDGALRRGIAKNAKRSLKRFLNCLEPLNIVSLTCSPVYSYPLLTEAQLQMSFQAFRRDPMIMGIGNLITELILALFPENDPHEEGFILTVESLKQLDEGKANPVFIASIWILRLMLMTGYYPHFDKCNICGIDLERKKRWVWQLEPLRYVCADHHLKGGLKWEWDLEVLMFLRSMRTLSLDKIWRLKLSKVKQPGLFKNICSWCEFILQRELKSYRWLERVAMKSN